MAINATTSRQLNTRTSFIINRGYTSHEHLDMFNLINMNGRIYDPVVSRFISADNYIQAASFSQSYNRYSYCMNNPLMFTDPSGEKWWQWALTEILTGGLVSATATIANISNYTTLLATASTIQAITSSIDYTTIFFEGFSDIQKAGDRFDKALKTDFGIIKSLEAAFYFDESAEGMEWPNQIFNNFHGGESIQSIFGNGMSHLLNINGKIDEIGYYEGRTIVRVVDGTLSESSLGFRGVSHGHYIFGDNMALNPDDIDYNINLFAHEFGHTYQSRNTGPAYYFKYGLSSGTGANFSEDDADYRAHENLGIWPHTLGVSPIVTSPTRMEWWEYFIGPFVLY